MLGTSEKPEILRKYLRDHGLGSAKYDSLTEVHDLMAMLLRGQKEEYARYLELLTQIGERFETRLRRNKALLTVEAEDIWYADRLITASLTRRQLVSVWRSLDTLRHQIWEAFREKYGAKFTRLPEDRWEWPDFWARTRYSEISDWFLEAEDIVEEIRGECLEIEERLLIKAFPGEYALGIGCQLPISLSELWEMAYEQIGYDVFWEARELARKLEPHKAQKEFSPNEFMTYVFGKMEPILKVYARFLSKEFTLKYEPDGHD